MDHGDTNHPMSASGGSEIVTWDACALSRAISSRRVSCEEVMRAYLAHIDKLNPQVNAIISLRDPGKLIAEAQERDHQLACGEYMGWMHGFPQAIKDLAATRDIRTTFGSPLFKDFVPPADAAIVQRVRQSGAIIIGKTNVPEFGLGSQTYNPVFGITRNAYAPAMTAGGSSGGAAVALALRMLPVADGSDMMGSLRNPAAFNNVLGFRPSYGRVPAAPSLELFLRQLSTEGPMGRSVSDVAMLLSIQAGYDTRAPLSFDQDPEVFRQPITAEVRGRRIAWLGDWHGYFPMEPGIMDLCRAALRTFSDLGCEVDEAGPEFAPQRLWNAWLVLRHWLMTGNFGELYSDPQKRSLLKPELRWEIENGLALSAVDVYRASMVRSAWYEAIRRLFERFDYLALPSAQVFPFDAELHWPSEVGGVAMDTYHRWMEVNDPRQHGRLSRNLAAGRVQR